jgi:signal transduction histidine kinase
LDSSTTHRNGGTRLGLAVTRELLVHLNCEIPLRSALGQGIRFTVNFPLPDLEGVADGGAPDGLRVRPVRSSNLYQSLSG